MKLGSLVCFITLAGLGCATPNYGRSVHGTVGGYSLANAKPRPPSLMVTRKIERPLYIVLDASRVKDTWSIETASCAADGTDCERFSLFGVQTFVTRDLRHALENHFSRVEVVGSTKELPSTPHVVADVKVDDIRLTPLARGMLTYQLIEMNWGFAMRAGEHADYAYSFAGTSQSNDSYPTFEAGCAMLVENAIASMLEEWVEADGPDAFHKLSAGAKPHPSTMSL